MNEKFDVLFSTFDNKGEALGNLPQRTLEEIYKYSQGVGVNECVSSYIGYESGVQTASPSLEQVENIDEGRYLSRANGEWEDLDGWNSETPYGWPGNEIRDSVRISIEECGLENIIVISRVGSASNVAEESTSILAVEREDVEEGYAIVYWKDREFGAKEARKSKFDASPRYRVFKPHSITQGRVSEGRHSGIEILSIETDEMDIRSRADVIYDYENVDYVATANDVPMRKDACILRAGGGEIRGHRGGW